MPIAVNWVKSANECTTKLANPFTLIAVSIKNSFLRLISIWNNGVKIHVALAVIEWISKLMTMRRLKYNCENTATTTFPPTTLEGLKVKNKGTTNKQKTSEEFHPPTQTRMKTDVVILSSLIWNWRKKENKHTQKYSNRTRKWSISCTAKNNGTHLNEARATVYAVSIE